MPINLHIKCNRQCSCPFPLPPPCTYFSIHLGGTCNAKSFCSCCCCYFECVQTICANLSFFVMCFLFSFLRFIFAYRMVIFVTQCSNVEHPALCIGCAYHAQPDLPLHALLLHCEHSPSPQPPCDPTAEYVFCACFQRSSARAGLGNGIVQEFPEFVVQFVVACFVSSV